MIDYAMTWVTHVLKRTIMHTLCGVHTKIGPKITRTTKSATQGYRETLCSTRSAVCRTVSRVRVARQGRADRVRAQHQRSHSQQIRRVVWLAIPAAETRYATSKYCDF